MFKKVLSAFVEVTEDEKPAQAPSSVAPVQQASTPTQPVAPMVSGAFNPQMHDDLMQAISKANIAGYDYLELKDAIKNMAALPFTEEQKIMAAFATVTHLTTAQNLVSSVDAYLKVVDSSEAKFLEAAAQKEKSLVTGREEEIKVLDQEVATLSNQILEATNRINALQTKKATLASEKEAQRVKIDAARTSFQVTAKTVREQLMQDRQKISNALK
jgi:hypothetical protein